MKKEIELEIVKDIQPEKTQLIKNKIEQTGRIVITESDISNEISQLLETSGTPHKEIDDFAINELALEIIVSTVERTPSVLTNND